jgi:hypothetical protein
MRRYNQTALNNLALMSFLTMAIYTMLASYAYAGNPQTFALNNIGGALCAVVEVMYSKVPSLPLATTGNACSENWRTLSKRGRLWVS